MSSYPESPCGEPRRGCVGPQPSAVQFAERWVSQGEVWSRHVGHSRCVASGTPVWAPGPGVWLRRRGPGFLAPRKPPEAQLSPFCRCVSVWSLSGPRLPRLWSGVAWQVPGAGCSLGVLSPAAELMERAAVPPLWPALYPPGRTSLHHAQQLQLFSQQHFLRQQEFLYLQQQAAQALELQRSAQLVVSWGGGMVAGGLWGPWRPFPESAPTDGEAEGSAGRKSSSGRGERSERLVVREGPLEVVMGLPRDLKKSVVEEPSGQRGHGEQAREAGRARWGRGGAGSHGETKAGEADLWMGGVCRGAGGIPVGSRCFLSPAWPSWVLDGLGSALGPGLATAHIAWSHEVGGTWCPPV